ncbi:hypothetical protein QMM96_22505 [Citrobacter freundii]|uniref:hypothetical protein n=1 Tax=Citrobacter freundii TaxID=546 RepID=UPI002B24CCD0|nr:hypothetical protein [Citrobacter freundii]MEB2478205.1 hypothetical protein [Citrobacter freundii]
MPKYESQSDVIRAIKKASDAELRALADITQQLGRMNGGGGTGGLRIVRAANAGKYRQPRSNEIGQHIQSLISAQNKHNMATIPAQVSLSTVRKTRQNVQKAINSTMESAAAAVIESIEGDITAGIGTKTARRRAIRKPAGGAAPAGHYYDNSGRLRDSTGRYASKAANEQAKKSRASNDDAAETNGLLKKLVTGLGKGAGGLAHEGSGDIGASAAGMGVMWQASKELASVVKGAGKNTIDMTKFLNEGRKSIQKPIIRGFSANDARASVKENQEIKAAEAAKAQHKDNVDTHANQEREISLLQEIAHKIGGEGGGGGSWLGSALGGLVGGGLGLGMFKRFLPKSIRARLPGGKGVGKLTTVAEGGLAKNAGKTAIAVGEEGLEKVGKGSMVKAGGSLLEKGGLKAAAKVGLRAIPIIGTLGAMAYDAYTGATDDDQLRQTFGKNIGGKERFAAAAANVADMGGLVSGISNGLSSAMDAMGFDQMASFFSMNGSQGLAKQIDTLIGGSEAGDDKRNESLLDKLSEIVSGIKALTPEANATVTSRVNEFANDVSNITGRAGPTVTQTVYDAKGDLNTSRLKKGMSVNPIAQIQTSGSSKAVNNNNPGNLRFAGQSGAVAEANWKANYKGDTPMASFATPEEGVRAFGNQLMLYQSRDKINTISGIVSKYAPKGDHNNTDAYIRQVVAKTGIGANDTINTSDPAVMTKLVSAFGQHEGGFSMSDADIKTALGTVQGGKYVGGFTKETTAQLQKTPAGRAILANNTGASAKGVSPITATPAAGIPVNPATAQSAGDKTFGQMVGGWVKSGYNGINNATAGMFPGLKYSNANAGVGLGGIKKTSILPALNADALVNASPKNALPIPATLSQGGGGLLSDVFNQATQGINGGQIMQQLTHGMAPGWQYALNPLTNAAGRGVDSALNLGRQTVGGWLNGSSSTQRTVTDLSASGARLSPDSSVTKAQTTQQSTLEEIASYLEQILGIQKKPPADSADKAKAGPQPGPSGDIPLASSSSVINTIIKRDRS